MKIVKTLMTLGLLILTPVIFAQDLPDMYQPMFNEIIGNFKTIRGSNSITSGKNTLSVINENRIAVRIDHKKSVKNLTFITESDEENNLIWVAANELTIDMVNKYEDDLTEILKSLFELSQKKSKE